MQHIYSTIVLVLVLSMSGCEPSSSEEDVYPITTEDFKYLVEKYIDSQEYDKAISLLERVDYVRLVREMTELEISSGEYWGVRAYHIEIPSIDNMPQSERMSIESAAWIFPGTSDDQISDEEFEWNDAAYEAAKKYNMAIGIRRAEK